MKPDWKDAPEWANYLAMDGNSTYYWYEEKPYLSKEFSSAGEWFSMSGAHARAIQSKVLPYFEKRPEVTQ